MYITLAQLADSPGPLELAQVSSPETGAVVDTELMRLALTGGDRSAYTVDEVAAADAAAAKISAMIVEAQAVIDGYVGKRYGYAMPFAVVPVNVTVWARSITRYKLHGNRISDPDKDPIARDYRDAIKFLTQVAAGNFSLGIDDPEQAPSAVGDVRFDSGTKVFGRAVWP